jgi:hypothetical protein
MQIEEGLVSTTYACVYVRLVLTMLPCLPPLHFSAQALALLRMVSRKQVVAHWGTCAPNDGGAPEAFRNFGPGKRAGRAGGGRGRRRAKPKGAAG